MLKLIIEENVRLELLEHAAFCNATQEEYFVDFDSPTAQCCDNALVRRRISYGYNSRPMNALRISSACTDETLSAAAMCVSNPELFAPRNQWLRPSPTPSGFS
jgi:hypothetical protein